MYVEKVIPLLLTHREKNSFWSDVSVWVMVMGDKILS